MPGLLRGYAVGIIFVKLTILWERKKVKMRKVGFILIAVLNKLIGKWKPVGMEDYPDAIEFLSDGTMIFLGEDAAGSDGPIEKGTYYMEEGILYVVLPWDDEVSVCEYKFLDNQYQYLDLKFESGMGTSPISFYRVD